MFYVVGFNSHIKEVYSNFGFDTKEEAVAHGTGGDERCLTPEIVEADTQREAITAYAQSHGHPLPEWWSQIPEVPEVPLWLGNNEELEDVAKPDWPVNEEAQAFYDSLLGDRTPKVSNQTPGQDSYEPRAPSVSDEEATHNAQVQAPFKPPRGNK